MITKMVVVAVHPYQPEKMAHADEKEEVDPASVGATVPVTRVNIDAAYPDEEEKMAHPDEEEKVDRAIVDAVAPIATMEIDAARLHQEEKLAHTDEEEKVDPAIIEATAPVTTVNIEAVHQYQRDKMADPNAEEKDDQAVAEAMAADALVLAKMNVDGVRQCQEDKTSHLEEEEKVGTVNTETTAKKAYTMSMNGVQNRQEDKIAQPDEEVKVDPAIVEATAQDAQFNASIMNMDTVRQCEEKMMAHSGEEEKVDSSIVEVTALDAHAHFAGRKPAGTRLPVCVSKDGVNHVVEKDGASKDVLSVGLACSECFSGPRLAEILRPGFEYEQRVMMDLLSGKPAAPLSIHTSGGVSAALADFISALEPHLPWRDRKELDWCVSLQLEGASAVWAGVDMLLQLQLLRHGQDTRRRMVAVGARSYHGPPSTSPGSACPLFPKGHAQVEYPVPVAGEPFDEDDLLARFDSFLEERGDEVGVLLVEPQWGSSQCGLPWPEGLLREYVRRARARGMLVLADEIMCGLGRHGQGTLFLSEAWGLDPDAVTFGKAIGGGVYPLSGAVLKTGGALLGSSGRTVMQSHTYAGSSVRALMAGASVLRTLPLYFDSVRKLGEEMTAISSYLERTSDGLVCMQGQGLMWGALVTRRGALADASVRARAVARLRENMDAAGVLPYFVPAGGFMVSPPIDVDVGTLYEVAERMEAALGATAADVGWARPAAHAVGVEVRVTLRLEEDVCPPEEDGRCLPHLHFSRTCTGCGEFVRLELRRRFSEGLKYPQSLTQELPTAVA